MMRKLVTLVLALAVIVSLVIVSCAKPAPTPPPTPTPTPAPTPEPQETIELKFSHHCPPTAWATTHWLDPWAKEVEKATNNGVKVTMYPAQSLVAEKDMYTGVESNITDIGWVVLGLFKGRFPLSEVMSLPFMNLLEGTVNGERYSAGRIDSRIYWELYEKFPEMQAEWSTVKVLYVCTCPPAFLVTKKPVHNLQELKGLKIRAHGGGQTDVIKAAGGVPVEMSIPDIYTSAEKGVIDGMIANYSQLTGFRLYEVFDYYTPISLTVDPFALIMSKDKWNSLPPDVQKQIASVSGLYGAEFAGDEAFGFDLEQGFYDAVEKAGATWEEATADDGVEEEWKEIAGKPVWDKWAADMEAKGLPGQAVINELLDLLGKYK